MAGKKFNRHSLLDYICSHRQALVSAVTVEICAVRPRLGARFVAYQFAKMLSLVNDGIHRPIGFVSNYRAPTILHFGPVRR